MLLRFTTADMLNTALLDITTGQQAYTISTVLETGLLDGIEPIESPSTYASVASSSNSSENDTPPSPSFSRRRRRTTIKDQSQKPIASLVWNGRHPEITIGEERVGGLTDLFGSNTVRFMPKILAIPTRFDTEYIWTATADSLTLVDFDSDIIKGVFHQNAVKIPGHFNFLSKRRERASSSPLVTQSPASSHTSLTTTTTSSSSDSKASFIHTRLPGIGSSYLEFTSHPLAHDVEIIISFIMMEILRRGRFSLTPYCFNRPRFWQLQEARDSIFRRLRRGTL
ncbi:hypothetical protein AMATHDRAFT_52935 [Amanita thiersii Skay4041]|uniref:Uncharacterized protein n=1 Tax=Amanita thiersii Skay4041 TaxID=703135 RepID=A0A2A9P0T8_9AGAR|nr:hypothetical protein AMATHDRAFT_52935 [Amanita thiersii Skay4041]